MKRFLSVFLFLALFFNIQESLVFSQVNISYVPHEPVSRSVSEVGNILSNFEDIVSYAEVEKGLFKQKLEVMIRQPLDYGDPKAGCFEQRFVLCHVGFDRPTVIVTEGYRGSYALRPGYMDEIARHYNANILVVEHRYFEKSTPSPRNWEYLTVENSMNDLHRINQLMRQVYPGKWIATGISKGGQTTIMYKTYFPDDVDVSVPYVAPVCFGIEDGRHEPFIEQCGTLEQRARIQAFQREALERREEIWPLFEALCATQKLVFRIPIDEVYDYCVLEYSFAFWQWGTPVEEIPLPGSSAEVILNALVKVAGPDYFSINPEPSFYVQAARELGYYGYDVEPFEGLLKIEHAKGYLHRIMMPEDARDVEFDREVSYDIYRYLRRNDPKMIFIYGEFDPWSAVAVDRKVFRRKKNMLLMIDEGGSHRARIATLSPEQQAAVWGRIDKWLNE